MSKDKDNSYAKHLIGFGMGTGLAPVLISALGASIPEDTKWTVWGIGLAILVLGSYLEYRSRVN